MDIYKTLGGYGWDGVSGNCSPEMHNAPSHSALSIACRKGLPALCLPRPRSSSGGTATAARSAAARVPPAPTRPTTTAAAAATTTQACPPHQRGGEGAQAASAAAARMATAAPQRASPAAPGPCLVVLGCSSQRAPSPSHASGVGWEIGRMHACMHACQQDAVCPSPGLHAAVLDA